MKPMSPPEDFNYLKAPLEPGFRAIEAGAGTGKTYSLIWVVVRLILEQRKQAREILMVTFTEAACLEMRQRLREMLEGIEAGELSEHDQGELAKIIQAAKLSAAEAKKLAEKALDQLGRMSITTIHGFCQSAFAEHAVNAGFAPTSGAPVDGGVIAEGIATDWKRSGRSPQAKLSQVTKAVRILMSDPACDVSALPEGAALKTFVADRLAVETTVTFDDLILRLRNALLPEKAGAGKEPKALAEATERAKELTEQIRKAYSCCLIDEFQDTDAAQWDVFEHLFGSEVATNQGALLIVVGDPKQAIYGFRGADLYTYLKAVKQSEGGQGSNLRRNFRSTSDMIAFFNALFGHRDFFGNNKETPIAHPQAMPPKGDAPRTRPTNKPVRLLDGNNPYAVANEVARLLKLQPAEKTIGVLVRNNDHANTLHRALVEAEIPAALESTQSVYETQTAFQSFLLLRAALRPNDSSARKSLLISRPALFDNLPANIVDASADQEDDQVLTIHNAVAEWLAECNKAWKEKGFNACWQMLTRKEPMEGLTSVREALARCAFRTRALIDLTHVGEHLGFIQAERRLDPEQLLAYLQLKVEQSGQDEDEPSDAAPDECLRLESAKPQVVVQTIHKSKGLEYDSVVLVIKSRKNAPTFPGKVLRTKKARVLTAGKKDAKDNKAKAQQLTDQNTDEDARLLYVALTRAKSKLSIFNDSAAEDLDKEYGFHKVLRSCGIDPATWTTSPDAPPPEDTISLGELIEVDVANTKLTKQPTDRTEGSTSASLSGPTVVELRTGLDKPSLPESRGWSSFSGLTKNHAKKRPLDPEAGGEDEDEDEAKGTSAEKTTKLLISDEIKGAEFGTVIHEILEVIDFQNAGDEPDKLAKEIEAKLITQQVRLPAGEADWGRISKNLAKSCEAWLNAPLLIGKDQPGHRVCDLPRKKCLPEVRFAMRGRYRPDKLESLAAVFAEEFGAESPLADLKLGRINLDGILTGVIDLAYEHEGRFYILDWKTNHLGSEASDYDQAGLDNGIAAHSYQIQFSLYAAALDLHLRHVYGDKWVYDPAKAKPGQFSFGGVQYVFLRAFGLKPDGLGCYYHLPSQRFIQKLQATLTE